MAIRRIPFRKNPMALAIDIVSDVVCPWCYIGKRRLEAALELYRKERPEAPAPGVTFHPF
jgi:predicted DsbA family dithiol-disulfide isomerase